MSMHLTKIRVQPLRLAFATPAASYSCMMGDELMREGWSIAAERVRWRTGWGEEASVSEELHWCSSNIASLLRGFFGGVVLSYT